MFNSSRMPKMTGEVVTPHPRSPSKVTEVVWVGFICKECGAPLAVDQSAGTRTNTELSTRGWRVTCTACGVTDYHEVGKPMVKIAVS